MIVVVNEDWRVRGTELQWILERLPEAKPGKERKKDGWVQIGYFQRLDTALTVPLMRGIRMTDVIVNGHEALARVYEAMEQIESVLLALRSTLASLDKKVAHDGV